MSTSHVASVVRIACVTVPDLPLQIALRDRPARCSAPVAVISEDIPEAPLVSLCRKARSAGLRQGMRQAAARGVIPHLRTFVVSSHRMQEVIEDLVSSLHAFSPRVEADGLAGVFFLDPNGLGSLYGGFLRWARTVYGYVRGRGFRASVVVGFQRARAHAISRLRLGPRVVESPAQENHLSEAVRLDRLGFPLDALEAIQSLGVHTLGDFLRLPSGELQSRFGSEVSAFHKRFCSSVERPVLSPSLADDPRVDIPLESPSNSHTRLVFMIKRGLHQLMRTLESQWKALSALHIALALDDGCTHTERIEPAAPTRDAMLVIELVRLRFEALRLSSPVAAVHLRAESDSFDPHQLVIDSARDPSVRTRDRSAVARALARLRAAFGPHTVTRAQLREAHLPEAQFAWKPIDTVPSPRIPFEAEPRLVRRVFRRVHSFARRPGACTDGRSGIRNLQGPYRVSGGWWVRTVERDYYYAEMPGPIRLWVYFDRPRRRWCVHGIAD